MNINKYHILIITLFVCFTTFSFAHEGATGIIKERMDKFKESKAIMREINKSFANKDFKKIQNGAIKLNKWGLEMGNFFPEGSNTFPSEANENIWLEPDQFKLAIDNFAKASKSLLKISQDKDLDKTIQAFRTVAGTCKGCHKKFRN